MLKRVLIPVLAAETVTMAAMSVANAEEKLNGLAEGTSMLDNTEQAPSASAAEPVPLFDTELDAVAANAVLAARFERT